MRRRHPGHRTSVYSERQWEVAERLVAGMTPAQAAGTAGIAPVRHAVNSIQASLGVLTVRSMCFRLLQQELLPAPGPYAALDLDPVTRTVWEGLRWDILDSDLVPALAANLRRPDGFRLSTAAVNSALDRLAETFRTTRHGLIRFGFAHGVLNPAQSTVPPVLDSVAAAPPGAGAWDPSPAHRRALALRASGRDVAACAMAEATTPHAITGRLSACRNLAGVRFQRALIHRALCDRVLLRPAAQGGAAPSPEERAVWRHLPLDVPDAELPTAISSHTRLDITTVHRVMRALRIRYRDDCGAVYAGWKHGVLDEHAPTDLSCCYSATAHPSPAPRPAAAPDHTSGRRGHGDGPSDLPNPTESTR
ncbi:hypothetical protein [Streptomyces anulatus]|uniref:hypothetical protein n=1 Tax=Streptomyces anulatus TaxID=1892 RepID=UPI002F912431